MHNYIRIYEASRNKRMRIKHKAALQMQRVCVIQSTSIFIFRFNDIRYVYGKSIIFVVVSPILYRSNLDTEMFIQCVYDQCQVVIPQLGIEVRYSS